MRTLLRRIPLNILSSFVLVSYAHADLLHYFATTNAPFMMECCERTEADKKGGHLAKRNGDGQLVLRESAQCAKEDSQVRSGGCGLPWPLCLLCAVRLFVKGCGRAGVVHICLHDNFYKE
jgi:hypothetical protein